MSFFILFKFYIQPNQKPKKAIFATKNNLFIMTISYNWLCDYLPKKIEPEQLSIILTSIGLEVESMEKYESVKGALKGLLVGEVIHCEKHPEADKLKLTKVNIGQSNLLNIVCGTPNMTVGQKGIVDTIGTTIYTTNGESITMKKAKRRGAESEGMICAEDEIGLGDSHAGITLLPTETEVGTPVSSLFPVYEDYIFEIGLTPNRMDAMSHFGVAKDVCAYLSYHEQQAFTANLPYKEIPQTELRQSSIQINIENEMACKRYCGILINDVKVAESPEWLQQKLKSIGVKSINNIVDITNFILHESGQPLHAFDAEKIIGNKIIVKNAEASSVFITLDEKSRNLSDSDLMICNDKEPMCMAGVYGGLNSGVTNSTTQIFLESAWFDGSVIRKTSLKHGLRTDAATRFEKGVDISNTMNVLMRAAAMIADIAKGSLNEKSVDIYPLPFQKTSILFELDFLKKLSGKLYDVDAVKKILIALGFEITKENAQSLELLVPFYKTDVSIQADIIEEIMRIDGLDNVEIPATITIAPSIEKENRKNSTKEKMANYMVGLGFHEIFTNSITNSAFYSEEILSKTVKMMNSLSTELNIMRPEMIQSGLQVLAHNINRKNVHLKFFEFGKTYSVNENQKYTEQNRLALLVTGNLTETNWNAKAIKSDVFYLKGVLENLLPLSGIKNISTEKTNHPYFINASNILIGKNIVGQMGEVTPSLLKYFDIKNPVYFADIDFDLLLQQKTKPIQFKELAKFPAINRDLSLLVDKNVSYSQIEQIALNNKPAALKEMGLFDIFENEKLGDNKKSMSVSFTFLDENKTMTDEEIDGYMNKLISSFEQTVKATIRK